jgi:hypothetical protein
MRGNERATSIRKGYEPHGVGDPDVPRERGPERTEALVEKERKKGKKKRERNKK